MTRVYPVFWAQTASSGSSIHTFTALSGKNFFLFTAKHLYWNNLWTLKVFLFNLRQVSPYIIPDFFPLGVLFTSQMNAASLSWLGAELSLVRAAVEMYFLNTDESEIESVYLPTSVVLWLLTLPLQSFSPLFSDPLAGVDILLNLSLPYVFKWMNMPHWNSQNQSFKYAVFPTDETSHHIIKHSNYTALNGSLAK